MKITIKNLIKYMECDYKDAIKIESICNKKIHPNTTPYYNERIKEKIRASEMDLILYCVNRILSGYGIKSLDYYKDSLYEFEYLYYINLGDIFNKTIIFNPSTNEFEINSVDYYYRNSPLSRSI